MMENKEILNEKDVAAYLGRSPQTIAKLRKTGQIPCLTIPGVRSPFYQRSTIDRWLSGDWTPQTDTMK